MLSPTQDDVPGTSESAWHVPALLGNGEMADHAKSQRAVKSLKIVPGAEAQSPEKLYLQSAVTADTFCAHRLLLTLTPLDPPSPLGLAARGEGG